MIKLTMQREKSVKDATLSKLYHNGAYICDVLEDVVREKKGLSVLSWKIKGVTAIPAGTYEIVLETSGRFGPNTMTLKNVPGYGYIRCHSGNLAIHTEGCLLFGMRAGPALISDSIKNVKKVFSLLWTEAFSKGEKVCIEILPAKE